MQISDMIALHLCRHLPPIGDLCRPGYSLAVEAVYRGFAETDDKFDIERFLSLVYPDYEPPTYRSNLGSSDRPVSTPSEIDHLLSTLIPSSSQFHVLDENVGHILRTALSRKLRGDVVTVLPDGRTM